MCVIFYFLLLRLFYFLTTDDFVTWTLSVMMEKTWDQATHFAKIDAWIIKYNSIPLCSERQVENGSYI